MSSKHTAKRANRPPAGAPWIWLTREMLEAPAWQAMGLQGRRVVERIMLEHMVHAGTENAEAAAQLPKL